MEAFRSPFALARDASPDGEWSLKRLENEVSVSSWNERGGEFLPSGEEWRQAMNRWRSGIPLGFHPQSIFNPLTDGDIYEYGCTRIVVCPELFLEPECLLEDAFRILDGHGYTKHWQQWKVRNAIVSLSFISTVAFALAYANPSLMDMPFALGNCLPRSILYPFTGKEGKGCRHLIKDPSLLKEEYNVSIFNTLSFVERSEKMPANERWSNGNFSGTYLHVQERVSNVTKDSAEFDSSICKWKSSKQWIGRQNLYCATPRMKRLVHLARLGRLHFIELDCKILKKWFAEKYVDSESGRLQKGAKVNARKDFPSIWKEWTGLRPAGSALSEVERYSSLPYAMKFHSREILDGSLIWTTHIEKIIRGLFIGSRSGGTIYDFAEPVKRPAMLVPAIVINERPKPCFIGSSEMEVNVEFDRQAVEKALKDHSEEMEKGVSGQLQAMLADGKRDGERFWMRFHFRKRRHGRFYGHGNSIQMLPKWLRKQIFPSYASLDLNCAVFSIMKSQLLDFKYEGKTREIASMVADREAYRNSLVNPSLSISLEDVKHLLTMIGYGCTMNIKRIVDAAEWNWLVEAYGIEPTLYEMYRYAPGSALAGGVNDPDRLMQIAEWASNPKVMELWNEMQDGGKFLFRKMKHVAGGRPVISNAWGEEMDVKSKRITFGQKLAHIYQGAESMLLWKIMDGFDAGSGFVKDSMYGFGVPMHDGFGLHRDLIKEDPSLLVEKYVKENVGWNLKYDCE